MAKSVSIKNTKRLFNQFISIDKEELFIDQEGPFPHYTLSLKADSVMALAKTDSSEFVINHEYRHSTKQELISLPGGLIDPGEDPIEAAQRELLEECGYMAKECLLIGSCYPFPGICSQKTYFVLCKQAVQYKEPAREVCEIITTTLKSEKELVDLIQQGSALDGLLTSAFFFYNLHQKNILNS